MPERATLGTAMLPLLVSACAYALVVNALGRPATGLLLLAIFAWYALPGFVLARFGVAPGSASVPSRVFGALWAYALSTIVLLILWVAGVRGTAVLVIVPPVIAGALLFAFLRGVRPLPLPVRAVGDARALLWLLLIVPLVVGRPFARVGEMTPDGRTYRAYFTADFVWRMAVAAEVAQVMVSA